MCTEKKMRWKRKALPTLPTKTPDTQIVTTSYTDVTTSYSFLAVEKQFQKGEEGKVHEDLQSNKETTGTKTARAD